MALFSAYGRQFTNYAELESEIKPHRQHFETHCSVYIYILHTNEIICYSLLISLGTKLLKASNRGLTSICYTDDNGILSP